MANKLQLNFAGGMNTKTSPLIIKDSEAEFILNYHLDKLGALTKRNGFSVYLTQPVAGVIVNGLYQFNDQSAGVSEQLMVANNAGGTNGVIYYNNAGTWTAAKTNDTASKKTRFASFVDYVFRFNGADVVASSTDGITWGTTNAPTVITPKFGAVFSDRVYAANGASSNRSRFWFSSLPSAGAITWTTATDWVDVNPDDGDEITALENNGNRLLIFKNRSLYRWMFGQTEPDRLIGVGTSSQESVKTNFDIGVTFFANPRGVYAYTSGRPKLVSRKIQNYIDAVSDWTNVFAEVDDDHYYLAVGNITVDGRTLTNAMLVYHISLDAWSVYTTALKVTFMARLIESGVTERVYFGSNNGRTYKFLDGQSDASTDILCEFISKEYLLAYPNRTNFMWLDVFASKRVNSLVMYDLDRANEFPEVGNLTTRVSNFRIPTRECNSVRVKITDNSQNTSVIEGFNMEHEPKEKRDEQAVQTKRRRDG